MSRSDNLVGLSYAWIRAQAREYAAAEPDQAAVTALVHLDAPAEEHRMLAVWLLGYTATARTDTLNTRQIVVEGRGECGEGEGTGARGARWDLPPEHRCRGSCLACDNVPAP